MNCPETLRTQAYLDGELDAQASADAEQHLITCPQCQAFVAVAAQASDLIRRHAVRVSAPEGLRQKVLTEISRSQPGHKITFGPRFWLGAGSGSALTALAAGIAGFFLLFPPTLLSKDLVVAHTSAMMQRQEISVISTDHHTVKPWFAGHIALSPPVADFKTEGFALTGGRIQQVDGISMAVVVYRHGAHHVDLFVWAGAPVRAGLSVRHGYLALLWQHGDLNFAAVSDMDSGELQKFATLVQAERE